MNSLQQMGIGGAFVGDFFQRWINTHTEHVGRCNGVAQTQRCVFYSFWITMVSVAHT